MYLVGIDHLVKELSQSSSVLRAHIKINIKAQVFFNNSTKCKIYINPVYFILHRSKVQTVEKKRIIFGVDHDSFKKQIEDYKQRWSDSNSEISSQAGLSQEQLDTLAEIRKQKLVDKKKRKAKKLKDYDVTPKEYLLAQQLQKEQEEEYHSKDATEDIHALELMKDEGKY